MTSEEVSAWLEPLFVGAEQHPDIDLWRLMTQATHRLPEVPESDVADRLGGWPDVQDTALVVDWIEFGQLLRQALGWDTYPERPAQQLAQTPKRSPWRPYPPGRVNDNAYPRNRGLRWVPNEVGAR